MIIHHFVTEMMESNILDQIRLDYIDIYEINLKTCWFFNTYLAALQLTLYFAYGFVIINTLPE